MCVFTGALVALVDDAPELLAAQVTEGGSGVGLQVQVVSVLLNSVLHRFSTDQTFSTVYTILIAV